MIGSTSEECRPSRLTKLFSVYVILLPILQYYKSPIPIFNMATFLSIVFMISFVVENKGKLRILKRHSIAFLYILFVTINIIITQAQLNYPISDNILDYLRTLLLIISILVLGTAYFDYRFALSALEKVLMASACFMVIQLFFYYVLHRPITGNIPVLVTNAGYQIAKERVAGFYMEPAAYSQSALLFLTFRLFGKEQRDRTKIKNSIIIILGILLSGSGQGYAFLMLLAIMWLLYTFFFSGLNTKKMINGIAILLLIIVGIFFVLQTSYGQYVVSRILPDESSSVFDQIGGSALSGRTYTNKLFYTLSETQQLWGVGFGRSESVVGKYYINSLFFYLIECGYISMGVWAIIILHVFRNGDIRTRFFALLYIIMFYFSGCGKPMMMCYFFSFLILGKDELVGNIDNNRRGCYNE